MGIDDYGENFSNMAITVLKVKLIHLKLKMHFMVLVLK